MVEEELTIESIQDKLSEVGYISNDEISTSMFLALSLNKPVLIEGPPGVGKTELAKSISKSLGRDFFLYFPYFLCQIKHRPALRPSCIKSDMSYDCSDFFL